MDCFIFARGNGGPFFAFERAFDHFPVLFKVSPPLLLLLPPQLNSSLCVILLILSPKKPPHSSWVIPQRVTSHEESPSMIRVPSFTEKKLSLPLDIFAKCKKHGQFFCALREWPGGVNAALGGSSRCYVSYLTMLAWDFLANQVWSLTQFYSVDFSKS